jgi:hypothetical protein
VIYYTAVPLTLLVVVLQVAAAPSFHLLGVHADLPVVWLSCWAAVRGRQEAMLLIPLAGLGLGLLGREPLGASLLALLPVLAIGWLEDGRAGRGQFLTTLLMIFVAGFLYSVIHAVASFAGGEGMGPPLNVLRVAPRAAMLDVLTAALWFWPIRLVFGKRSRGGAFRRA